MTTPILYGSLAPWFHLLTPPEEYADEAAAILDLLRAHVEGPVRTLLELGSGGGNTASHLRLTLRATLTDLSPAMLELSRTINPDTEHIVGDMRSLRLERTFDAVLIHDAIVYMTSEADLTSALETAFVHLRPGGAALFQPDHVRDSFSSSTNLGETDEPGASGGRGRGMRYLEWSTDPDPMDDTCQTDYALLLRHEDGAVEVHHDRHIEGLFTVATWLRLLESVGFAASSHIDQWQRTCFIGRRPAESSAPVGA